MIYPLEFFFLQFAKLDVFHWGGGGNKGTFKLVHVKVSHYFNILNLLCYFHFIQKGYVISYLSRCSQQMAVLSFVSVDLSC